MRPDKLATRAIAIACVTLALALGGCGTEEGTPTAASRLTPLPQPTPVEGGLPAPAGGDLPDRVAVTCGPGAPVLSTDVVRASRDGVIFGVSGTVGWMLAVSWADSGDIEAALQQMGGFDTNMTRLERDRDVIAVRVAPGVVSVACAGPDRPDGPWPRTSLRIEDPDGWFRPTLIDERFLDDCVFVDPTETVRGVAAPPVVQARARIENLQPGDVVERGGWPDDGGLVRVVREGRVIGGFTFMEDDTGGWRLFAASACEGLRLKPG